MDARGASGALALILRLTTLAWPWSTREAARSGEDLLLG
jgi:hypothetical protein